MYDISHAPKAPEALKTLTLQKMNERIQTSEQRRAPFFLRPTLGVAACLCLVAFCAFWGVGFSTVAVISIDVNPSIELALNPMGWVLDSNAFNKEGDEILSDLSLRGKRYEKAVSLILEEQTNRGYLRGESVVLFAVQSGDKARGETLLSALHQSVPTLPKGQIRCSTVSEETVKEAHSHGLSAGKYSAIQTLQQYDSTATIDGCRGVSMGEIFRRTDEACHGSVTGENQMTCENGQGKNRHGGSHGHEVGNGHH